MAKPDYAPENIERAHWWIAKALDSLEDARLLIPPHEVKSEKPYSALTVLRSEGEALARVSSLLSALVDFERPLPKGAAEWKSLDELEQLLPEGG